MLWPLACVPGHDQAIIKRAESCRQRPAVLQRDATIGGNALYRVNRAVVKAVSIDHRVVGDSDAIAGGDAYRIRPVHRESAGLSKRQLPYPSVRFADANRVVGRVYDLDPFATGKAPRIL